MDIFFPDNVPPFSQDELGDIASYKPIVDYLTYLYLRGMSTEQLQKLYHEYNFTGLSHDIVFFFVTRGYLPPYA